MKRILLSLAGLGLVTGLAVAVTGSSMSQGPLYTVAEVRAHLARTSGAWTGRVVRVRGIAIPLSCSGWNPEAPWIPEAPCQHPRLGIVDLKGVALLAVIRGAPNPLLVLLRRLPLTTGLASPPQILRVGIPTTYRVRLLGASANACVPLPCDYQVLLLDAAPDSP